MKQIMTFIVCVCMMLTALTGCSSNTKKQNTVIGGVTGALVGGLAGSAIGQGTGQLVAIGVGAIAGAFIGSAIGNSMDSSDCAHMNHAMNAPTNKSTHWKNKKTGTQYTMKPTSNMMTVSGNKHCRTFETNAIIDGKNETITGTACQQADGNWKTIKS